MAINSHSQSFQDDFIVISKNQTCFGAASPAPALKKALGGLLIATGSLIAFSHVPGPSSKAHSNDSLSLLSEDQFKDRLEELYKSTDSNEAQADPEGEATFQETVVVTSTNLSPLFGIILIFVAMIYLVVVLVQIWKARNNNRYEYTNSSLYSNLTASDLESLDRGSSIPNTCSYTESQMRTPNMSVYSHEQGSEQDAHQNQQQPSQGLLPLQFAQNKSHVNLRRREQSYGHSKSAVKSLDEECQKGNIRGDRDEQSLAPKRPTEVGLYDQLRYVD